MLLIGVRKAEGSKQIKFSCIEKLPRFLLVIDMEANYALSVNLCTVV